MFEQLIRMAEKKYGLPPWLCSAQGCFCWRSWWELCSKRAVGEMRASRRLRPPEQGSGPMEGRAASLWRGRKALSINHTSATAKGWKKSGAWFCSHLHFWEARGTSPKSLESGVKTIRRTLLHSLSQHFCPCYKSRKQNFKKMWQKHELLKLENVMSAAQP